MHKIDFCVICAIYVNYSHGVFIHTDYTDYTDLVDKIYLWQSVQSVRLKKQI